LRTVTLQMNGLADAAELPWILSLQEENGHVARMALTWTELQDLKTQLPHCFCDGCQERMAREAGVPVVSGDSGE